MRPSYTKLPLLVAAGALVVASTAVATEETPTPSATVVESTAADSSAATPAATPPTSAGLQAVRIGKDPKTGKLRPTTEAENAQLAQQIQAFWAQFPRHTSKTNRKTGVTSLVIAPHGIATAVATRDADGRLVWDCVEPSGVEQKLAALQAAEATAAQPEER